MPWNCSTTLFPPLKQRRLDLPDRCARMGKCKDQHGFRRDGSTQCATRLRFRSWGRDLKSLLQLTSKNQMLLANMAPRYLLHFAHDHISFRWPEFVSVTLRNNCAFKLISEEDHLQTRPLIIIELDNGASEDSIIKCTSECFLLKDVYEFWAHSDKSVEDLAQQVTGCSQFLSEKFSGPNQSFRVNYETFRGSTSQNAKIESIKKLKFLDTFQSGADLVNFKHIYCVFQINEQTAPEESVPKDYYFCRHLARSNRGSIDQLSLKKRIFIANTSMDPELSLIAANTAKVERNDIVYDPFVGSGSLLVAAAYVGAHVLGADIDWPLLHGKSKPSRKGETKRQVGESVRANLRQYNLESHYLDVLVSDITRRPFCDRFTVDAIISDPPYGVRECSEKIGSNRERKPIEDGRPRFPSKTNYHIGELLLDLLCLSAKHLKIGGRLVYFLPVINDGGGFEKCIPTHPSLNLVTYCEQSLTAKSFRLMVIMEKVREPEDGDKVDIPEAISSMNFRRTYFGG